eukprot:scaffold79180_cov58-Phaeocystis_antarctica.AAC.1
MVWLQRVPYELRTPPRSHELTDARRHGGGAAGRAAGHAHTAQPSMATAARKMSACRQQEARRELEAR